MSHLTFLVIFESHFHLTKINYLYEIALVRNGECNGELARKMLFLFFRIKVFCKDVLIVFLVEYHRTQDTQSHLLYLLIVVGEVHLNTALQLISLPVLLLICFYQHLYVSLRNTEKTIKVANLSCFRLRLVRERTPDKNIRLHLDMFLLDLNFTRFLSRR